jgi:hypothetical protein
MEFLRSRARFVAGACLTLCFVPAARADIFCGSKCGHDGTKKAAATFGAGSNPLYLPYAAAPAAAPTLGTVSLAAPAAEYNPLAAAHETELAKFRYERAAAMLKAEMDMSKRILDRMATSDCSSCPTTNADLTKIQTTLTDLSNRMTAIEGRLTSVEKLLLTHDNILVDTLKNGIPKPQNAPGNP